MAVADNLRELSVEAFDLVLELLEQEPPEVSGAVVADAFPDMEHIHKPASPGRLTSLV